MSFEWKLPDPPKPIVLEYDLEIPAEGESSEKLGYLEQYLSPGDVVGVLDEEGDFILEMLYDQYLCFKTLLNVGDISRILSGGKIYKSHHMFLG